MTIKNLLSQYASPNSLGQKIPHSIASRFNEDDEAGPTKRLKREHHDDTAQLSCDDGANGPNRDFCAQSPRPTSREISDSEASDAESDDLLDASALPTGVGTAFPPIKTDREAIQDYELGRIAAAAELHQRLAQKTWERGRTSIYVDAFNLALETVLEEESHLFDSAELAFFDEWRSLSYEGQYLYVRLFLRKTAAWHRIQKLQYYNDIGNIELPLAELFRKRSLPSVKPELVVNPGELTPPKEATIEDVFSFADTSEDNITTLAEASALLLLDELKVLTRDAKVTGKNKAELLRALQKASSQQTGLHRTLLRSETEESIKSEQEYEREGSRDDHFTKKVFACTGPCIRLSAAPQKLFERVHLVFYRSTEWTEKSLTTIILARISRRNFPQYIVSRSANIFQSRALLLEFEASLRTQYRVDFVLEFNGTVRPDGLQLVQDIFEEVYPRWKILVAQEQEKEERVYDSGEGAYLRRFSPAWVYTRIIHKGLYILGRNKERKREHQILSELLQQKLFQTARRGAWYQRKALLEEHYMYEFDIQPATMSSKSQVELTKKEWKRVAMKTCVEGLRDQSCHLIFHYDLQKRISKLERALRIPKREHHDFDHVRLATPKERTVYGIRVDDGRQNGSIRQARRGSDASAKQSVSSSVRSKSKKTIWLDEREDSAECSVESMCLSWYRSQGWKGYHSEGGIVRTLFGYLFADIFFVYVPNVFQTAYQSCPLDLHTDSFFSSRASEINRRLAEIGNGEAARIIKEVWDRESGLETCIIGIHWDYDIDDLLEIVHCFEGHALATLCKLMAQEYQQRGGGIPDLFLWKTPNMVMFAEVKSENDRLSDTQRLWIHVLAAAGIPVELCLAREKPEVDTDMSAKTSSNLPEEENGYQE